MSKSVNRAAKGGPYNGCRGGLWPPATVTEVIMSDELELELSTTQVEHEYGGSEIQVLEGL